jgi:hypothetical protein
MAYSPQYVSLQEVPVRQIPDDYDSEEKEDALEVAETSAELDLYDGEKIPPEDVTRHVKAAIKQKATCELVKGAEDPNSSKLGDLADDGSNKSDYAMTFCERYMEMVDTINESGLLDEDTQQSTSPYVYTTHNNA